MAYYHTCPTCGSQYRTSWFFNMHLKLHTAAEKTEAAHTPQPVTAQDTIEVQQFAELLAAAKERR